MNAFDFIDTVGLWPLFAILSAILGAWTYADETGGL